MATPVAAVLAGGVDSFVGDGEPADRDAARLYAPNEVPDRTSGQGPVGAKGHLVVMPPLQEVEVTRRYCDLGTRLESLACAVAAGLQYVDPLNTAPEGFDKQAF